MGNKRITLLCGHYGSGKTNIAVNLAMQLQKTHSNVTIADLDIVNPYFRTKDSMGELEDAGIRLICSEYANTNVDIPALPQELYAITDDRTRKVILDIGGDDRGALALGRIVPALMEENDYEMLMVINCYRPLTRDADSTLEVMREIKAACRIPFTGVINNSNLGCETTAADVLRSAEYANSVAALSGLPLVMTTVDASLYPLLKDTVPDLFPLELQKKI
ncbi:MAG: hypothetical protein E7643_05475 [Ruminococcaceae bacterium]|nr:hypothetical protein [Oscillospiraceae bacterium]